MYPKEVFYIVCSPLKNPKNFLNVHFENDLLSKCSGFVLYYLSENEITNQKRGLISKIKFPRENRGILNFPVIVSEYTK